MKTLRVGSLGIFALFIPMFAQAWDAAGHMLVNQIAWNEMTPKARAVATELSRPLDARFNEKEPYNFVTAGAWMDDMRGLGKAYQWGKLHYVTIPWTESGMPADVPAGPSVVSGIEDSLQVLRIPSSTAPQRIEALAMLTHFVGDIHQPLHTTDRDNDRGGNAYMISGVPFTDYYARRNSNLHSYWDKAFRYDGVDGTIVETWSAPSGKSRPTSETEGIIVEQAKAIMLAFPRAKLPEMALPEDVKAWAVESHKVGCKYAYPPGEPPPNTEVRPLSPDFVHASQDIAKRRVAVAGYRLGACFNRVLAK